MDSREEKEYGMEEKRKRQMEGERKKDVLDNNYFKMYKLAQGSMFKPFRRRKHTGSV